jgi:DNA segregation ATPase FtsK/SpoIIIE, S-DNA-T family
MPIAVAALDPEVDVTLLDGKQVELAAWEPIATEFVGPDLEHAIRVLQGLQTEMDRRYRWLRANRTRKVERGDGLRLHLVAVDELAYYLTIGDRNGVREFANLLRDLVSRGLPLLSWTVSGVGEQRGCEPVLFVADGALLSQR